MNIDKKPCSHTLNIRHAHHFTLNGKDLKHVLREKDLSIKVIFDMDFKFEEHMATKIKKANGIMGLIRRFFSFLDAETFKKRSTSSRICQSRIVASFT